MRYAIVDNASGAIGAVMDVSDPDLLAPNTPPGSTALRFPYGPNDGGGYRYAWGSRTFVSIPATPLTAAETEAMLIPLVKGTAATKKMMAMSPSTSKTEEYRLKAPEIAASANVAAAVLNALTAANAMLQYPAAATEQKLSGEPLATVLARFRAGAGGSNPEVNRLSAIEQVQCRRIQAATTAAAKRAVYDAIDWNWRP